MEAMFQVDLSKHVMSATVYSVFRSAGSFAPFFLSGKGGLFARIGIALGPCCAMKHRARNDDTPVLCRIGLRSSRRRELLGRLCWRAAGQWRPGDFVEIAKTQGEMCTYTAEQAVVLNEFAGIKEVASHDTGDNTDMQYAWR